MTELAFCHIDTPIGPLLVAGSAGRLHVVSFPSGAGRREPEPGWYRDEAPLADAVSQLREYFAGERREFKLVLAFEGTSFEKAVWRKMADIPYGSTTSYGALARSIGEPVSASRAVGVAAGANPLPVVIPCHRVVSANGALTGFGGGLPTKSWLLSMERRACPRPGQQLGLFD